MFMQSYQMENSLRRLRDELGEAHAEPVALTGTYNSLIRMWSEC
ncbi:hypothetical protein [Halomonas sp. ML-15]|nr:hypothetical protein [Halomonas sp. ML-15]